MTATVGSALLTTRFMSLLVLSLNIIQYTYELLFYLFSSLVLPTSGRSVNDANFNGYIIQSQYLMNLYRIRVS
jgi:hypothetical protein